MASPPNAQLPVTSCPCGSLNSSWGTRCSPCSISSRRCRRSSCQQQDTPCLFVPIALHTAAGTLDAACASEWGPFCPRLCRRAEAAQAKVQMCFISSLAADIDELLNLTCCQSRLLGAAHGLLVLEQHFVCVQKLPCCSSTYSSVCLYFQHATSSSRPLHHATPDTCHSVTIVDAIAGEEPQVRVRCIGCVQAAAAEARVGCGGGAGGRFDAGSACPGSEPGVTSERAAAQALQVFPLSCLVHSPCWPLSVCTAVIENKSYKA